MTEEKLAELFSNCGQVSYECFFIFSNFIHILIDSD